MTRWQADALLLFAAMMWGFAFVGQATAMQHVGPLTFIGYRFAISALVVAPFAFLESRRAKPIAKHKRGQVVLLGLLFFVACAFQQIGLLKTSVTNAGFLTALYVVMAPIIAVAFLKHPLVPAILVGAALSLAGTFLLSGGGDLGTLNWGDAIVVASALFWALQILLMGELSKHMDRPITLAFAQYAIVAILGIAAGYALEVAAIPPLHLIAKELFFTGVVSGALCFTLQAIAQRHTPASDAAILMSSEALFAALGAALLLDERLGVAGWIGCGLILIAVLLVQLGPVWKSKSAA